MLVAMVMWHDLGLLGSDIAIVMFLIYMNVEVRVIVCCFLVQLLEMSIWHQSSFGLHCEIEMLTMNLATHGCDSITS